MLIFAMIRFSVSMSSQGGSGLGMAPLDPRCRHYSDSPNKIEEYLITITLLSVGFCFSIFGGCYEASHVEAPNFEPYIYIYTYVYIYIHTYSSICLGLVFIQGRLIEATLKIPTAMAPIVPISGRVTIKPPLEISYLHGNSHERT